MSHKASSKLVTFLYLLARDYLPTGKIKNAINQSNELVGPELTADEIGTLAERWARELGVDQKLVEQLRGGIFELTESLKARGQTIKQRNEEIKRLVEELCGKDDEIVKLNGLNSALKNRCFEQGDELTALKVPKPDTITERLAEAVRIIRSEDEARFNKLLFDGEVFFDAEGKAIDPARVAVKPGTEKGDRCNRDGCEGIIDEADSDSCCSCHISPPCNYCVTDRHYCPICDWAGIDEQNDPPRKPGACHHCGSMPPKHHKACPDYTEPEPCGRCDAPIDSDFHHEHCATDSHAAREARAIDAQKNPLVTQELEAIDPKAFDGIVEPISKAILENVLKDPRLVGNEPDPKQEAEPKKPSVLCGSCHGIFGRSEVHKKVSAPNNGAVMDYYLCDRCNENLKDRPLTALEIMGGSSQE